MFQVVLNKSVRQLFKKKIKLFVVNFVLIVKHILLMLKTYAFMDRAHFTEVLPIHQDLSKFQLFNK